MLKIFLCIWLFLNFPAINSPALNATGLSQENTSEEVSQLKPLEFQEEKLKDFRKDSAFDYSEKVKEENWWTRFKRSVFLLWKKILNWLFGDLSASPVLAIILKALPYLILIGFVAFVIYMFTKLNPGAAFLGSPKKAKVVLDEEENIIKFEDIKALIAEAVANNDFNLAVRYHFLYILQQLSHFGVINYDSSKTDEDYLHEIEKEELKPVYKKLNRIYDFVWYGKFETGEEVYLKIKTEFSKMETLINTKR